MNHLTDQQLFEYIQRDNEQAFEVLLQRYSSRLYKVVFRHTRHADTTKDILQDIFLGVWKNRRKMVVTDTVYPYLYRSAKNAVIDQALATARQVPFDAEQFESLPGYAVSGDEPLQVRELELAFQRSVDSLPEKMRAVILLSREQQLSAREIAAKLNISEQTVRNNISMALKSLRKSLGLPALLFLLPSTCFFDYLVTLS
nr:sigma-70 family RNA polymerase sigma factor [uncultured Chitinophaga sp.]